ncbi:MAG: P-loop NTPase [Acidobacteriota bacterium]
MGGGKGGTGKSLVAANLGIHLAQMGRRVVLVDGDLGAANLHTLLGLAGPPVGLGDFIDRRVPALDDAAVPTGMPRLRLISGAGNRPETESLKHFQKLRLLRFLVELRADVVVVDLGAGTSLNVLDLFCVADQGVLVILPEPTSIENCYRFIKAAFRRRLLRLARLLGYGPAVGEVLSGRARGVWDPPPRVPERPREILEAIAGLGPPAAEALRAHMDAFLPCLIVNQARGHADVSLGESMRVACDRFLGLTLRLAGVVPYDPVLVRTVKSRRALLAEYPRSRIAEAFRAAAEEIASARPAPPAPPPPRAPDGIRSHRRSPYEILEIAPGSSHQRVLAAYMRLRSALRSDSAALLPLDCERERRAALAEVEQAFRSLSNSSVLNRPRAPSARLWPPIPIG